MVGYRCAAATNIGTATKIESVGLLRPTRVAGDRRRYTPDDLVRVASIVIAKQAGLPLKDIGTFLAAGDPAARKELHRNHCTLQARMAALRAALDLLEAGLNCSHEDITTCPNYRAHLARVSPQGPTSE
ncbi:MerR family transcriptional regulator [Nocardia cyriacigeorgica]|uniref:MerR family transcriptional regulator n=1 Tax=Nocardia cyriacigeorgica TaxID=135487 RepID=A0A5R8P9L4_9NOCA|nr:MerR family transcriptional regulator [Nocardia cyriacigeorgica]